MRKNKILILSLFFIFVILSILQGHAYMKTSIQGVSNVASGFSSSGGEWVSDRTMCEGGQDFAVQIEPFGCEPAVVRSDLLEEQNVPVFCQLSATKINPFIGVEAIESISFSGQQFPKEISGVGFYPAQAALGINGNLNSPVLNNIGYAVIVLKKQENSSSMPKMVSGNLTARLKYDIQTAYGVGNSRFYLPEISDEAVWGNSMKSYGFWNGKGYLRAESISPDSVKISVYTDTRKLKTISLNKGETSPDIYLPGFDCLVGAKLKLEDLVNPDTRAVLSINGETIQVNKGEKFLENKCTLISLERRGLTKKVSISCSEDEGTKRFELVLSPKVSLKIGDKIEDHEAGDFLYEGIQNLDGKDTRVYVYLTYIGTKSDSSKLEDLYIQLVSSPLNLGARLGDSDIAYYSSIAEGTFSNVYKNKGLLGVMAQGGQDIKNKGNLLKDSLMNNRKIKYIHYVEDEFWNEKILSKEDVGKNFAKKEVHILNFASPVDVGFKEDGVSSKYYSSASQDYSKVINSFAAEKEFDEPGVVLGEEAFVRYIILSNNLNQKQEVKRLCGEFKKAYPDPKVHASSRIEAICENPSKSSSATSSSYELTINSRQKIVSLEDVKEPSFEEYGARIKVTLPDKTIKTFDLMKNKRISIDSNQYAQLISMDEESISIIINRTTGVSSTLGGFIYGEKEEKLVRGVPNSFGTAYKFEIIELYSKKNAKVSVLSTINKAQTDANFSFNIGIEQRSIKLSPEKTKEKIENLNKTISDWSDKSEKLGKVVEGMKGACLATGVALTMKGFVNSAFFGEQSIARGEIMLGKGGWNERCMEAVSKQEKFGDRGPYSTVDQCIIGESTQIDKDVSALSSLIKKQNDEIKSLQERANCKVEGQGFFFETVMNTECVKIAYAPVVAGELRTSLNGYTFDFNGKQTSALEVISLVENKKVSIEDMRKLQLYARAKNSPGLEASSKKELDGMLAEIYASYQDDISFQTAIKNGEVFGIEQKNIVHAQGNKNARVLSYLGGKFKDLKSKEKICKFGGDQIVTPDCTNYGITEETPVQSFTSDSGKLYIGFLEQRGAYLFVKNLYDVDGTKFVPDNEGDKKNIVDTFRFELINSESYSGNTYKSSLGSSTPGAMLKCYETAPYKGVPAITPVDTKNGWYVYIPQTVPSIGSTSSVDASGRVTSYYLCNIWKNGQEEFSKGDDECYGINLMTGQSLKVGRLDDSASKKLIDEAGKALEKAQKICRDGKPSEIFSLGPNAKGIRMGSPAANIPAMQCSNFMSPSDCKRLFNVCDPVICPSSRCNFGGKYPVADVVQSGIIGSLVLCLPNFVGWKGDVWIPVCLSGLKAGIDGLLSVFSSYRDCLQESLNTGKMTGVCDEIYSIHLCEFFWRQALPLAKMIIPKTIELLMGQSVRGGGEYMNVQNAWANAGQSIEYFTQYYSSEAYATFKARITEGVTDAVCKTYISGAYPDGGKILTSLTQASSPPQFHGRFDEIPFTTATNPAVSHYKVFYHIYAGKESRAYYQVYLTEGETSSYYQDTMNNVAVAGGYIETGGTASETKDFTAPSGYKKLCIVVNGQKECGFKQVSTSFAVDYVSDQYVKSQMSETGITSESDCVSGTASAWSLATISLEGAADELASPKIYNRGIIRVCASRDPGSGTDRDSTNPRYVEVGYCGDKNLKCWLDKDSVKGAVNFNSSVQEELDKMTKDNLERMKEEGKYLSEEEVGKAISEIRAKTEPSEKINLVNSILGKVLMNAEKGTLYLLRANAYKALAEKEYAVEKAEMEKLIADAAKLAGVADTITETGISIPQQIHDKAKEYAEKGYDESRGQEKNLVCARFVAHVLFDVFTKNGISPNMGDYESRLYDGVQELSNYLEKRSDFKLVTSFNDLEKGDLLILDDSSPEREGSFNHVVIFSSYGSPSKEIINAYGEPGASSPAYRETFDLGGSRWKITKVHRYAGKKVEDKYREKINLYYFPIIREASTKYGVDESLIKAIITVESGWNPNAVSGDKAQGLMQLTEKGAIADIKNRDKPCYSYCIGDYNEDWKTNPRTNIFLGTCYLKCLKMHYLLDNELRIAAYNAGPTVVNGKCKGKDYESCKGDLPEETRDYVEKVLKDDNLYKGDPEKVFDVDASSLTGGPVGKTANSFLWVDSYREKVVLQLGSDIPESCMRMEYTLHPYLRVYKKEMLLKDFKEKNGIKYAEFSFNSFAALNLLYPDYSLEMQCFNAGGVEIGGLRNYHVTFNRLNPSANLAFDEQKKEFSLHILFPSCEKIEYTIESALGVDLIPAKTVTTGNREKNDFSIKIPFSEISSAKDFFSGTYSAKAKCFFYEEEELRHRTISSEGVSLSNVVPASSDVIKKIDDFMNNPKIGNVLYSENAEVKAFIDKLHSEGVLNKEEYAEITGEGFFDTEENLSWLKNHLRTRF